MKNKPEIILLVGNIGSGKSTLTNNLTNNHVIISKDALRYMIGNGAYVYDINLESAIHQSATDMVGNFMKLKKNIVIDETNMIERIRNIYISLAIKYHYKVIAMIMPKISKEEAIKRRTKNPHGKFDKGTWEYIWNKFNIMYEEPTKSEGIDKIIKL